MLKELLIGDINEKMYQKIMDNHAMEEAEGLTFEGTESQYGLMVEVVNGEKVDFNVDKSYWGFYVNGDYCNYGIDTQPVEDGDAFKIEYTISQ